MNNYYKIVILSCIWPGDIASSQRTLSLNLLSLQESESSKDLTLNVDDLALEHSGVLSSIDEERSVRTKEWNRLQTSIFYADNLEKFNQLREKFISFKQNYFDIYHTNALCDDSSIEVSSKNYWDSIVVIFNEQAEQYGAKKLLFWDQHNEDDIKNVFFIEEMRIFQGCSPVSSNLFITKSPTVSNADYKILRAIERASSKENSRTESPL